MSIYNHELRKIMVRSEWMVNPRCCVCGIVTVIQPPRSTVSRPNTATYGHIYSKCDVRRYLAPDAWQLECYKCNNGKEKEENPAYQYKRMYGHYKYEEYDAFPELLIALAETKENEIYLTQIEFKK